jgi:hypothetical protein
MAKLRFNAGDRVMVAEHGVGTVTEVIAFWTTMSGEQKPSKTPYKVVLDHHTTHESVRLMGMKCREDELTLAPEDVAASADGTSSMYKKAWRADVCPRCGEKDLKKLIEDGDDEVRCETCKFLYEPTPWNEAIKAAGVPKAKKKGATGKA